MRLPVITAILASAALIAAPAAFADGDPASDVLAGRALFNPVGSGVSPATQARLEGVLEASQKAGFKIRVALIASEGDLGTATTFWGKPGDYAYYLYSELKDLFGGQVLVVMPNGFGLWGPAHGPNVVGKTESAVVAPKPGPGEQLADSAMTAVPLLARAAGHPIASAALTSAERSSSVQEPATVGGAFSPSVVIALVAGTLLMAAAWWASLRARPLQARTHRIGRERPS